MSGYTHGSTGSELTGSMGAVVALEAPSASIDELANLANVLAKHITCTLIPCFPHCHGFSINASSILVSNPRFVEAKDIPLSVFEEEVRHLHINLRLLSQH